MKTNISEQLKYVTDNIPYYSRYKDASITDLPIINKLFIRNNYDLFVSTKIENDKRAAIINILQDETIHCKESYNELLKLNDIIIEETSGTSGISIRIAKSMDERASIGIKMWKYRRSIDTKVNYNNFYLFNHTGLNAVNPDVYNYNEEHICNIYRELTEKKTRWIHTSIVPIKKHIEILKNNPKKFDFDPLKYIELTGNYLNELDKEIVEEYFDAKVINMYGTIETWGIAFSCERGSLHVCNDIVLVELVDEDHKIITKPNTLGKVVLTTYINKIMPFVRYETGDLGMFRSSEDCLLSSHPIIELSEGRAINYIKGLTKKCIGSKIFGGILSDIKKQNNYNDIIYVQFVQTKLDKIIVNINDFSKKEEFVNQISLIACDILEKHFYFEVYLLNAIELKHRIIEKPNIFICKC